MKRAYDPSFAPPAPMVPVRVRRPGDAAAVSSNGKLDSGADLCGIPRDLIERLSPPPIRSVRAAGFSGDLVEVLVYAFDVEVDGEWLLGVEGIATRRPYVILGRNVLRSFVLRLDGPRDRLELRHTLPR